MVLTVAIADDHSLFRDGLAELLEQCGFIVILRAGSGRELIEKLQPDILSDVLLLDTGMPGMSSPEIISQIKTNYPGIKIMALCMDDDKEIVREMMESGAHGYVFKYVDPSELKRAVRAVIKKGYYHSSFFPSYYLQKR